MIGTRPSLAWCHKGHWMEIYITVRHKAPIKMSKLWISSKKGFAEKTKALSLFGCKLTNKREPSQSWCELDRVQSPLFHNSGSHEAAALLWCSDPNKILTGQSPRQCMWAETFLLNLCLAHVIIGLIQRRVFAWDTSHWKLPQPAGTQCRINR